MICIFISLLVCWSRVYVGSPYVGDVFGGGIVGIAAAIFVYQFYSEGSRLDRYITSVL